ncbi:MAG: hypothetical protein A2381_10870 [Bdellovibrionales bacterium RIFOXYB1_FULL_37_110]|nr:MAG: hypothetical protein A2181_07010 [Bdellovibrionales bacterium RIFOXYA1_FULL_38_20]OFZ51166.1 MAG: hypothetical protein A2417_17855 [Bdellovibrionales bacterium RIFOXYC1_FULL_37_79]OFZ61272.1 MAG: hypothetical protein A2381_10870 [Bdellovibrionales bacterium RIFOXYB1_FULL_37_110]OFZ62135.1 MAG: hypothetical protein A2577_14445 [Bdellovibrionales bacterium RIFOXYD1_FULL_36_51]
MLYRNPDLLYLGLVCAFIWSIAYFKITKKAQLIIPKRFIGNKRILRRGIIFLIGMIGWVFITISIMGPRKPLAGVENEIDVIDIYFIVDVSNSMQAIDFKPNRLEVAKAKIKQFMHERKEDRIAIIIFAESAFTLLPLTTDFNLVIKMADKIGDFDLSSGTNIGDAIGLTAGRAGTSLAKNKIAILLTDGVNNVGSMTPLEAAEEARKQNLKIYTIGIGSDKNALLPQKNRVTGEVTLIPLPGGSVDLKTLQEISKITGGHHFYAEDENSLKKIFSSIQNIEKSKIKTYGKIIYDELYIKYLIMGVILMLICEISRRWITREGA